jgi:threonine/homoserine/homoserine lactone efflux protein
MGQAIGELLPFAVAIAISPIPIIAIILMLISDRARANSVAFMIGWIIGIVGGAIVLLALAGLIDTDSSDSPSTTSSIIRLAAGGLVLVLAVRNFRKRPKAGEEAELPAWMRATDALTPRKAAGLGIVLSAVNPKNLLLMAAAMMGVAQYDLDAGEEAVVVAVFVAISISTVVGPVIIHRVAGARTQPLLDSMKTWLSRNSAVIMAVLLLVIGVVLVGRGISGLSA